MDDGRGGATENGHKNRDPFDMSVDIYMLRCDSIFVIFMISRVFVYRLLVMSIYKLMDILLLKIENI